MLGNAPRPPRLRRYHTHKRLPMDDDDDDDDVLVVANLPYKILRVRFAMEKHHLEKRPNV
jgi:hypothetical protein